MVLDLMHVAVFCYQIKRCLGKNVIIFVDTMSSVVHTGNGKKNILILHKVPTDSLNDTTLTGVNCYKLANSVEIYNFKTKDSEINTASLCLGNVLKYFLADNMKKVGLYRYLYVFSVDYDSIDVDDISYIHIYLMKKHHIKLCLG